MYATNKILLGLWMLLACSACFEGGGGTNVGDPIGRIADGGDPIPNAALQRMFALSEEVIPMLGCVRGIHISYLDGLTQKIKVALDITDSHLSNPRENPLLNRLVDNEISNQSADQFTEIELKLRPHCRGQEAPHYSLMFQPGTEPLYVEQPVSFKFSKTESEVLNDEGLPNENIILDFNSIVGAMKVSSSGDELAKNLDDLKPTFWVYHSN